MHTMQDVWGLRGLTSWQPFCDARQSRCHTAPYCAMEARYCISDECTAEGGEIDCRGLGGNFGRGGARRGFDADAVEIELNNCRDNDQVVDLNDADEIAARVLNVCDMKDSGIQQAVASR